MKGLLFSVLLFAGSGVRASTLYVCDLAGNAAGTGKITVRLEPLLVKLAKNNTPEATLADGNNIYQPRQIPLAQSRVTREGDDSVGYVRWSWRNTANGSLYINGSFLRGDFLSAYGIVGVPDMIEYRFENCEAR